LVIITYPKRRRKAGFFLTISESFPCYFANFKICDIMYTIFSLFSSPNDQRK
jgi:hypothetical protein